MDEQNPPPGQSPGTPAAQPAPPETETVRNTDPEAVREQVIAVLKTIYDPEIPVNIYELGLIYEIRVEPSGSVRIVMTLTSPMCPVAGSLPPEVETKVQAVPTVTDCRVDLVWEPSWNMNMMTEAAKLQLNLM